MYNIITDANPFVEEESEPNSVFHLKQLEVNEGQTWSGMRNELMFKITTTYYDFDQSKELFIYSDDVYANHLGVPGKMAVYIGSVTL